MTTPAQRAIAVVAAAIVAVLCLPPLAVLAVQAHLGRAATTVDAGRLLELLGNTLLLAGLVVAASLLIGTLTAVITQRSSLAGRRVWSTLVTVPLVLPAYVVAVALTGMWGGDGVLSQWLAPWGVERLPPAAGLWAATACLATVGIPVVHALVAGALQRIDPAMEDGARLLGDPPWRVFVRVTVPQLRGTLAVAACLVALYAISDFGAVSMLRYDTFTRAVYAQFRGRVDLAPAFALCAVLVAVAGIFVVALVLLRRRDGALRPHARAAAPRRWSRRARAASVVFLGAVVTLSSVLPIVTLATWAARGLANGAEPGPVIAEAVNTIGYALAAGLVTTLLALPVALAALRGTRFGQVVESTPWVVHSLPHLAIGLAILVLSVRGPAALYQSPTTLVLAYAAIFLPLAVGPILTALRRVDDRLLDVSRSLGRSDGVTVVRVLLPLARPSALTGATLVFFAAFHELPVTLLLRPTGSETLAVRVWGAMVEGQYTTASIAALLMVAISLPLLALHARATVREAVAA